MLNLSFQEFESLAKEYNVIPIYKEILLDVDTPLSVYLKIASTGRFNYILESVEKGEKIGRYSFIGSSENFYIRTKNNIVEIYNKGKIQYKETKDPINELKKLISNLKPFKDENLPPFWGGYVGYVGYDVIKFYEPVEDKNPDTLNLPDVYFFLSDEVIAFDNLTNKIKIIVSAIIQDDKSDLKEIYENTLKKINVIEEKLTEEKHIKRLSLKQKEVRLENWQSNFTKEDFEKAVIKAKDYITEGDIIQVVLSQRFSKKFKGDPLDIYRAIRVINPSPYLFYLDFNDIKIVGSSPEILVSVMDRKILTKPIAGTRPRGKTEEEDRLLREDLLNDEKEKAEHLMLVDLARNDVGKVAVRGSVKVDRFMYIENYSHVMHIVSDVSGTLREDLHPLDVLKSVFPVGTVSGAPKVRAMQIIEELEPDKRGIYAGAVGYVSFDGNLDTAIAIRTAVIVNDTVYVQAGAGIVADSVPEKEWLETVNKAKAIMTAVEVVE
ncbi:anthranilate synthase component I family protein [Sulfurihydrogenibium sp.]|uniref:anthranilate synthase component I n=2 Tax=Sulfurihydrogenibium sp. TaxID=2053621 RepID=UPI000CC64BEA|nr:MAG: anthranilate synthase component I [Sulfurihydrogenibium sp.]